MEFTQIRPVEINGKLKQSTEESYPICYSIPDSTEINFLLEAIDFFTCPWLNTWCSELIFIKCLDARKFMAISTQEIAYFRSFKLPLQYLCVRVYIHIYIIIIIIIIYLTAIGF
jgi:hypothetical protein